MRPWSLKYFDFRTWLNVNIILARTLRPVRGLTAQLVCWHEVCCAFLSCHLHQVNEGIEIVATKRCGQSKWSSFLPLPWPYTNKHAHTQGTYSLHSCLPVFMDWPRFVRRLFPRSATEMRFKSLVVIIPKPTNWQTPCCRFSRRPKKKKKRSKFQ